MKIKILSFITDGKEFLALRNNSLDPTHGGDFWFTVTGAVEKNETIKEAAIREVKEETNLNVKEILYLNLISIYKWNNKVCKEHNFISFVNRDKIRLNEEHTEFKWLNLKDYVNLIDWRDDKELLKKMLSLALNKKYLFENEKVLDYRKVKIPQINFLAAANI